MKIREIVWKNDVMRIHECFCGGQYVGRIYVDNDGRMRAEYWITHEAKIFNRMCMAKRFIFKKWLAFLESITEPEESRSQIERRFANKIIPIISDKLLEEFGGTNYPKGLAYELANMIRAQIEPLGEPEEGKGMKP